MIATSKLKLTKGRWKLKVDADDGVRVLVNGQVAIEKWSYPHLGTNVTAFEAKEDAEVDFVVEHFENDGWALLRVGIEKE